jgi:hypothetical protein
MISGAGDLRFVLTLQSRVAHLMRQVGLCLRLSELVRGEQNTPDYELAARLPPCLSRLTVTFVTCTRDSPLSTEVKKALSLVQATPL